MQLSLFAQTPLVADRRRPVHFLCRAQAVVDHTHADDLGLIDVLDVLHRPRVPRQRQSSSVQPVDFRPLTAYFFFWLFPCWRALIGCRPYIPLDYGFYVAGRYCSYTR